MAVVQRRALERNALVVRCEPGTTVANLEHDAVRWFTTRRYDQRRAGRRDPQRVLGETVDDLTYARRVGVRDECVSRSFGTELDAFGGTPALPHDGRVVDKGSQVDSVISSRKSCAPSRARSSRSATRLRGRA